ncbi:PadR family transcriptional regulator [Actinoplanes couchii]|uniref:PadR family transcriptional regulator n=1 Tax=Actinoplanes couchii TaxID=403638 RepID=A0ABQ3X877_9ACTN|nr:helix-turn-helix transcriptional regulator [Actinoplanes couchii]MDR6320279.1 DNA-binding PadR family transcriptional regulator [Actinoplanes couchii]GID54706.1 PadR family transcriptional regulator [Actinoplanes couchii]
MVRRKVANTLALAVLGLLQEKSMHPYEMASTLRERGKDSSFKITTGSLYDTVAALVRHEWITPVETVKDGRRPERTVYTTTETGQQEFVSWVDELIRTPVVEYPKFLAAVSYLGALGPERAADALGERAGQLELQITEARQMMADTVGSGLLPRLFMIEGEYGLHVLAAELEWTVRTRDEIRDGTLTWPAADGTWSA